MNKDYFLQSHLEKLCSKNYYHLKLGGGFKYFLFSPLPGEDEPILTHIFQIGWFNHQLESLVRESFPTKIINDMFPQIHLHQFCLNKLHNLTSTTAPAMPLCLAFPQQDAINAPLTGATSSPRPWARRASVSPCQVGEAANPLVLYGNVCQNICQQKQLPGNFKCPNYF